MAESIARLKNRLSVSKNSYGFFFYAGHGLQHNGINYLIPARADIPNANYLGDTSISVQTLLAELNDAGNELNVIVLDACRDFPATWSRSLNRGLAVVSNPPANHIVMYATGAGAVASDGMGRNGLFTYHLLNNLRQPNNVNEIFRQTMSDVARASNNTQRPALYTDFAENLYLVSRPNENLQHLQLHQFPDQSIIQREEIPSAIPEQSIIHQERIVGKKNLDGVFFGLGTDIYMNSPENFALSGGLHFGFDLSQRFAMGLKTNFSGNDVYSELEAAALFRFFPFSRMFFLQTETGIYFASFNEEMLYLFLGGINIGWLFLFNNNFYIEPVLRAGYPFFYGARLTIGYYFTQKKNK